MFVKVDFKRYENVCDAFLKEHGWSSSHYAGKCHSLAYDTIKWMKHLGLHPESRWIKPHSGLLETTPASRTRGAYSRWHFHCVVYYQRKVHDVWFGSPITLGAYIPLMFPKNKNVSWRREAHDPIWVPETYTRLKGRYE